MKDLEKEFKPTTWSINNKTSIFVMTIIITLAGIMSYNSLPKEKFPDIVIPTIYVSTVNFGTSPKDMENLITKPLEKQIKAISGVKKLTSNSIQDFSNVIVEFNTDVSVPLAKQKVKDAVDKARTDLPQTLTREPNVIEVDFSEMPIMYVNISGDFDLNKLKNFADDAKDKIEGMREITRVDIVGALDREIQINVDKFKMEAADVTMRDIEMAVKYENMTMSAGLVKMDAMKRSISILGEFKDPRLLNDIIIRSSSGATVYLKDIAEIKDGFKEKESYARLAHKNVITLNVIKRSGENLIEASDKVREIIADLQKEKFPKDLKVTITGDQSTSTRVTLHDLINTIIIGFILVTLILMFFMGATNALFVAMSVPLSCFLAFLVFPSIGFNLNMIVLFAFLLALGIVVDDAIVVIENTHRIFDNGKVPIKQAAKIAAGEIFLPVLSGTLTTLAPFIPLAFWKGIIGKFMFFLPVTLIVTLLASLVVAYLINPVFAVQFMKPHQDDNDPLVKAKKNKGLKITGVVFAAVALLFYISGNFGMGNFILFLYGLILLNRFVFTKVILNFQTKVWPAVQDRYARLLNRALQGRRPIWLLVGTVGLLIFSFVLTGIVKPKVVFFPNSDPNFVYTYINLPVGTNAEYTDSITRIVEDRVYKVMEPDGKPNPIVESIISNVAVGATDPNDGDRSTAPNKGKVSVAFVEFAHRNGASTSVYLDKIREAVKGIPGAEITVDKEAAGPPVGKPVSIEITGDDLTDLIQVSKRLKLYLDSLQIPGVEELKSDIQNNKPEIVVDIDRERANREGISTAQIGGEIRNAVFGAEVSKFRDANDEYPIQLRYKEDQRNNIDVLMNLKITYRDMNMGGMIRQVPLASVAKIHYDNTFGGIKRKNQKRIVTLSSNVLSSANPNEVVGKVQDAVARFSIPSGISIDMTGEQQEQKETGAFLGAALMTSLGLIFLILVMQFNSISRPLIILSEILFSVIGVLLGMSIFNMQISIIMTGIGIVALAGIVVRNGILLVEFTDLLMEQGMELKAAIIEAGRTRMTPVILTASATILGLIPLAVGLNIDFVTLFTEFNPHIFFGGDSVAFWGPLSWTMIFGLSFATFLTLILVPAMYLLAMRLKQKLGLVKA
ncbi:MAG: efflux RND transporter permease subunit [Bacteroidetes bacterium]|nr:efflux RND transporter permease subunit [Bacteroidota bacterium]MBK9799031.1 efflux RND transporter permease subunit [Bacteroidota bacterium]MBP6413051.1 efflux RND transporter permease subunit [Bacteroidia bacterium]